MKKYFFLLFLSLSISNFTNAQDYKLFKLGAGIGYASSIAFSNGFSLAFEPAFNLNNNFSISFKIEGNYFDQTVLDTASYVTLGGLFFNSIVNSLKATFIESYTFNSKYYVIQGKKFRPYAGIGVGAYHRQEGVIDAYGNEVKVIKANAFGFSTLAGFDFGHFNLALDYNILPGEESYLNKSINYFSARVGYFFGGGKKKVAK